nr:hypothetical protein [Allomuricauda sp.]
MSFLQKIKFLSLRLKPWTDFNKEPKKVFRDGCDIIGKELSLYGFKYLKSKRLLIGKSKNGDFSFLIFLNTGRFNQTGKKVYMNITCAVTSDEMGEFRNRYFKSNEQDNLVTSFHPGYISAKNNWIRWNLIKIHPLEIAHLLKENALTAFDKFEHPEKLATEFNGILPREFDFHCRAVDFLMMYSNKEKSKGFLDSSLKEKGWSEEFGEILSLLKQGKKPEKKHRGLIILLAERAISYRLIN